MTNRLEYPQESERIILHDLTDSSKRANVAVARCHIFALDRNTYLSPTAPTYQFVDISATLMAAANKTKPDPELTLEEKFNEQAKLWRREISGQSSLTKITGNKHYSKIIKMGTGVIPFILRELQSEPAPWFLALRILTENAEVGRNSPGNFEHIANEWINWGKANGHITEKTKSVDRGGSSKPSSRRVRS
jgi:hypothetical protein